MQKSDYSIPEKLVHTFFNEVWSPPHNLSMIDQLMTEDYAIHSAGKTVSGRENFKKWVTQFHQVLKNARTVSQDIFFNEKQSKVVSRWLCSGNNNGIFGLPKDEREISFTGIAIWEIKDERLATCWVERSAWEVVQKYDLRSS